MPVNLFDDNKVNASALYHYIYHFIDLAIAYYKNFDFQSIIDLRFELKGITNRELVFITKSERYFRNRDFKFDEEIEAQTITIDISDLSTQKVELAKSLIQPLFFGIDIDVTMGLCGDNGKPLYYQ